MEKYVSYYLRFLAFLAFFPALTQLASLPGVYAKYAEFDTSPPMSIYYGIPFRLILTTALVLVSLESIDSRIQKIVAGLATALPIIIFFYSFSISGLVHESFLKIFS